MVNTILTVLCLRQFLAFIWVIVVWRGTMNEPLNSPPIATQNWRHLVEAAIFETDPDSLSQRIQEAQDAVMDDIEESFQTSSQIERQAMINAMNSLLALRRLIQTPQSQIAAKSGDSTDA
jgi:hypothetical protein